MQLALWLENDNTFKLLKLLNMSETEPLLGTPKNAWGLVLIPNEGAVARDHVCINIPQEVDV